MAKNTELDLFSQIDEEVVVLTCSTTETKSTTESEKKSQIKSKINRHKR